ncbi:hypothetical protein [Devosia sp. SL43]|uniref:hypothetical protein n=1 Tax=Devosia sp. SL43 TaxID=2806348 RepID=UPI001F1D1D3D|nr:hypothetical protein [Devosia sp. SL43]UJW85021.1 hypothetical protein IM737_16660 [Devosia sp. SL43]
MTTETKVTQHGRTYDGAPLALESHEALIPAMIDFGHRNQPVMPDFLDAGEEPEPQVLRRDMFEERGPSPHPAGPGAREMLSRSAW